MSIGASATGANLTVPLQTSSTASQQSGPSTTAAVVLRPIPTYKGYEFSFEPFHPTPAAAIYPLDCTRSCSLILSFSIDLSRPIHPVSAEMATRITRKFQIGMTLGCDLALFTGKSVPLRAIPLTQAADLYVDPVSFVLETELDFPPDAPSEGITASALVAHSKYVKLVDTGHREPLDVEQWTSAENEAAHSEELSVELQLAAMKQDGMLVRYIANPSREVQLAAVTQDGFAIQYIEEPSLDVQLAAVRQNGLAIQYIKEPSRQVQLVAVTQDGFAIQYIEEPSLDVQLAAVKQDGRAICYMRDVSPEVQLAAVRQNGLAVQYIKEPSRQVLLAAAAANHMSIFVRHRDVAVEAGHPMSPRYIRDLGVEAGHPMSPRYIRTPLTPRAEAATDDEAEARAWSMHRAMLSSGPPLAPPSRAEAATDYEAVARARSMLRTMLATPHDRERPREATGQPGSVGSTVDEMDVAGTGQPRAGTSQSRSVESTVEEVAVYFGSTSPSSTH